ncbi:Spermidine N(1)-acetyltransferase [uncultured Clostridium sp.]|nr:Spermidine N(1)-acetyltransferase [uncultured Clostridium sp.]SCI99867.1 Spermidine N(1)-acetyltransferase [uncultured Clostridium sp.]
MKKVIKESDLIKLRLTQYDDLEFVIGAENESENAQYIGNWSKTQHLESLSNSDILHLIIEDSKTGKDIGYIIMAGLDNPNHNIEFKRFVICDKGKGFGKETLRLIKEYSFNELRAHRLWLDVRYKNKRAQNVYKSQGFKEEGILRECILYKGNYESLIVMSILENEQ